MWPCMIYAARRRLCMRLRCDVGVSLCASTAKGKSLMRRLLISWLCWQFRCIRCTYNHTLINMLFKQKHKAPQAGGRSPRQASPSGLAFLTQTGKGHLGLAKEGWGTAAHSSRMEAKGEVQEQGAQGKL